MTDNTVVLSKERELISNPVLDNIYARRSVRNFTERTVPDDVIRELIRAGTYAPSAVNKQPWRFVIVNNKEAVARYGERARKDFVEAYKDSGDSNMAGLVKYMAGMKSNLFYGAPLLILVFASPDVVSEYDCALAAQNMMLAAHSLGIGSCWIGLAGALGYDKEFLKEIGVPGGHKLIAPLIFGYPVKKPSRAPARNEDVVLNWIKAA